MTSVFNAIDEEVGPLQSKLPGGPQEKNRGGVTAPGSNPGADTPGGAALVRLGPVQSGVPVLRHRRRPSGSAEPSRSGATEKDDGGGLLGGSTGGLLGPDEPTTTPSSPEGSAPAPLPPADVTLPPLLPGLLPGLSIDEEDAG